MLRATVCRAAKLCVPLTALVGMSGLFARAASAVALDPLTAKLQAMSDVPLYRGGLAPYTEETSPEHIRGSDLWQERGQVIAVLRRPN